MTWIIDKLSPIPVYAQIVCHVKKDIILGRLKPGDKLPPIRDLAKALKINQNTVVKAYQQLVFEGLVEAKHGTGFFVTEKAGASTADRAEKILEKLREVVKHAKASGISYEELILLLKEVFASGGAGDEGNAGGD